jgi:hypothetical protein
LRKVLLAFFAGLLTSWSSEREQRFAFALPEIEGRISLGVFDTSGKLVRTLFVGAAESEFTIGLNGLITSWDGKDDAGKPLPRGNYRVRGYLVGNEVKTEGVAYHFNDSTIGSRTRNRLGSRILRISAGAREGSLFLEKSRTAIGRSSFASINCADFCGRVR